MIRQTDCTPNSPADQKLAALAFDRKGQLLGRGEIDEGVAYFKLEPAELRRSRVFVLPEPEGRSTLSNLSLEQIAGLATYEPRLRLNDDGGLILGNIPESLTLRWFWKRCCVRGRITNRARVEGQWETYPVCNATIHVCEVDRLRYWVERIPENILDRLRYGLIERIPRLRPIPVPPFPDPPFTVAGLDPQPEPPSSIGSILEEVGFNPQPDPPIAGLTRLSNVNRLQALQYQITSLPTSNFRQFLVEEYLSLRPYLCLFPYLWPYLYRCEEVAVVETDNNGRYEACFWHQETAPDVYLWIEYPFATGTETVYRPQLACATRWDYDCATDFDVRLYDSRIPPVCGVGLVGTSVAIRAVGVSVSPLGIEQSLTATTPVPGPGGNVNLRTVGLTNYKTNNLGGYSPLLVGKHLRPYTGSFPIIAQFGSALPAAGIHYFQVEYRQTHAANLDVLINPTNLTAGWKTLQSGGLSRTHVRPEGLDFKYGSYNLGPFTVGGEQVYRIPPFDPQDPGVDGIPPTTEPLARWTRYDRVRIGQVNTNALSGDGLYEFRIRFLDGNGDPATVGSDFFRVPNPADASTTMVAPAEYIRTIGSSSSFLFRLRIDNSALEMSVEGVSLNGDPDAMTDCGFIEYLEPGQPGGMALSTQMVGLTFTASHPQDFGFFSFNLERGRRLATGNHFTMGDAAGMVSGSKAPFTLGIDGKYRASFSVEDLLAGCGGKASFSEVLSVVGLHTDGYNVGNFFRRSLSNSFALAPQNVECDCS
ncbi:MAG: hypothetical protein AAGA31_02070 [Bacteroidota bacterium]